MAKNTVEKGDAFENKVYNVLKNLLEKDELPVSSKRSQVHQKKSYYSKVREDYICFDITIETYLPNETEYSFLWIIVSTATSGEPEKNLLTNQPSSSASFPSGPSPGSNSFFFRR